VGLHSACRYNCLCFLVVYASGVLGSESQHKMCSIPSVRNQFVDYERMWSSQRFSMVGVSVLRFIHSFLHCRLGDMKRIWPATN